MRKIAKRWAYLSLFSGFAVAAACGDSNPNVGGIDAGTSNCGNKAPSTVFHLVVDGPASDFCDEVCGHELTILGSDGKPLALDNDCGTACADCKPVACPLTPSCPAAQPLLDGGLQWTWDGTIFTQSTCGSNAACSQPQCASQGHYIARMCAYQAARTDAGNQCAGTLTPTCTEVPFDWPTPEVHGTISAKP